MTTLQLAYFIIGAILATIFCIFIIRVDEEQYMFLIIYFPFFTVFWGLILILCIPPIIIYSINKLIDYIINRGK